MTYQFLTLAIADGIATVTLNRPERRNALSLELMNELIACLDEVERNEDARVVILAAAGKVFSSGHDLKELVGGELEQYREIFDVCTKLMTKIQSIPQPVIAQVQGIATAAGCQLVATCDLAIASDTAQFATPGVKIGLFCSTPAVAVTRAIGRKRAMEMLLTGNFVDARTAADWGLVNRVVAAADLEQETRKLAAQVADASACTMRIGKHAFYEQIDQPQSKAYETTKETMARNAVIEDAQEGITAFIEKRPARWSGR